MKIVNWQCNFTVHQYDTWAALHGLLDDPVLHIVARVEGVPRKKLRRRGVALGGLNVGIFDAFRWLGRAMNQIWVNLDAILESYLVDLNIGLESGIGSGTIWLARRVSRLTSVEHDRNCVSTMQDLLRKHELTNVNIYRDFCARVLKTFKIIRMGRLGKNGDMFLFWRKIWTTFGITTPAIFFKTIFLIAIHFWR
ncbi:hypothetical protein [Candidatus Villigracilis saccharophilus]|uniref:hypothetical protein n=1 Tax=Candidatus Villigracilis saccharophilus TaxID=3140684 RepID=UPI0031372910|nr:hypothetical protein [Anaerolineales bacterium]